VMNANKTKAAFCFLTSFVGLVAATSAIAGPSAPALFGVQEIMVEHGRMGNEAASANCGTSGGEVATMVEKALKMDNLPVFSVIDAPDVREGAARISLLPEVVTLQPTDKSCISWISLTAQSRSTFMIPPVSVPRDAIVNYWHAGVMVGSNPSSHARTINEAIDKMAAQFSRQYRLDQPPSLSPTGK
jgi:hypothetical protein